MEIPTYVSVEIERPVLEAIPDLDVSDFSEDQIRRVVDVLAVYNGNMMELAVYAERLENEYRIQTKYMQDVIDILNRRETGK